MEFFAFKAELIAKDSVGSNETKRGIILSTSYPKAMNSLMLEFRDNYEIDNIYLDSLLEGNILTIDSADTYDRLVEVFNDINREKAESLAD